MRMLAGPLKGEQGSKTRPQPHQADQQITYVAPFGILAKKNLGTSDGPNFIVVLSAIYCSALHITLTAGVADTLIGQHM